MEAIYKNIFYAGITFGEYQEKGCNLKKLGLPVKKAGREYPYLLGMERAGAGKLQVYYVLLPEFCGKTLLTGKPKGWKPQVKRRLLEDASERAFVGYDCRDQILAPEFTQNPPQIPQELLAVCLYRLRPFDRICISLPREGSAYSLRQVLELIVPYLPRMRQVMFAGDENQFSGMLEEYLYNEFGIVMTKTAEISPDMPWLDFRENESAEMALKIPKENLKCVSSLEALKFLDTAVKNGYNTEVN